MERVFNRRQSLIKRNYYSLRSKIGDNQNIQIPFEVVKRLFLVTFNKLWKEGYFQENFGIDCCDGFIEGSLGEDIESIVFLNLHKNNIWPVSKNIDDYNESDLFDAIEFLYDHCSKGNDGFYHNWNDCGMHYTSFDENAGKQYYRDCINDILSKYENGFELSVDGEILHLVDNGLDFLLNAEIPAIEEGEISIKMLNAIKKFRSYQSNLNDRKDALRDLADILEFLRDDIKQLLVSKDENDLFNIANNFGIRHHNLKQKHNYDKSIWYSWMFYFYLASIHAIIRLKKRNLSTNNS